MARHPWNIVGLPSQSRMSSGGFPFLGGFSNWRPILLRYSLAVMNQNPNFHRVILATLGYSLACGLQVLQSQLTFHNLKSSNPRWKFSGCPRDCLKNSMRSWNITFMKIEHYTALLFSANEGLKIKIYAVYSFFATLFQALWSLCWGILHILSIWHWLNLKSQPSILCPFCIGNELHGKCAKTAIWSNFRGKVFYLEN